MNVVRAARVRATTWLAGAVVIAHVVLLLRLLRPAVLFGDAAVRNTDHALHWYRAFVAGRHFLPCGRLWGYDPFHTAGTVTGTVHDLDNKAVEVFVGVFGGVFGDGRVFNFFLFLGYGAIPMGFLLAARVLRLRPGAGVAAAAVAVAAFHGDPYFANWTLFGGFGHVLASAAAPVVVAVLARRVERPDARSAWWLLATAPLFYVHVLAGVFTAVLGLGLIPRALRAGPRRAAVTLAVVAAIVIVNLPWIAPMLGDWGRIVPTPAANVTAAAAPFAGLWKLVSAGRVYGLLLPVVAGGAGVILTWRSGRRTLAAAWGLGGVLVFLGGFEGNRSAVLRALVEPTRLKVTLPLALALPAGVALAALAGRCVARWGRRGPPIALAALLACGYPVLVKPLLPRAFGDAHVRSALDPRAEDLFTRMRTLGDPRGRLALEEIGPFDGGSPPFKAYLAAIAPLHTGRAMIGGPYYRGFTAEKVAAFVNGKLIGRPIAEQTDADIAERLDRYDVTGIAACTPTSIQRLRAAPSVVKEVGEVLPYVLFAVRRESDPTLVGEAEMDVDYDRISVRPLASAPIVLKLHYDERLSVPAPLVMTREPVPDGDPGFIRVEGHGGRPFEITTR